MLNVAGCGPLLLALQHHTRHLSRSILEAICTDHHILEKSSIYIQENAFGFRKKQDHPLKNKRLHIILETQVSSANEHTYGLQDWNFVIFFSLLDLYILK